MAAAMDGKRGGDEELESKGGQEREGETDEGGGETKDGVPWPPPHWIAERREQVMLELRATAPEEKTGTEGETVAHSQHKSASLM